MYSTKQLLACHDVFVRSSVKYFAPLQSLLQPQFLKAAQADYCQLELLDMVAEMYLKFARL